MAEWVMKKLKDIADFNPRESLAKGVVAKKVAMDKLQPFCRDIPGYELEPFSGGTKFRNGDTIMARITPCLENGKTAKVAVLDDGEVGFGSTEYIVFRAKDGVDEDFIYYLVCSPLVREPAIKSMVGSSGRQRVQTDVVQNLEIMVPDYEEQKRISGILKSLDDKIAANTEVNKNLEEQAQLLFTDRFVVNNYTVAQEAKIGDICKCILGGTPSRAKAEYWGGTIPWINSGEINRFRIISPSELITQSGLDHSATKMLPAKTTVLAITGATLGQVSLLEIDACANQSVVGIIPNDTLPYEFIYPFIKAKINELISHQTGGAQQHINKQNVESLAVSIPTKDILYDFVTLVSPMYSMIASNCFENMRLENMRDSLLPQLMSGELDISDLDL